MGQGIKIPGGSEAPTHATGGMRIKTESLYEDE